MDELQMMVLPTSSRANVASTKVFFLSSIVAGITVVVLSNMLTSGRILLEVHKDTAIVTSLRQFRSQRVLSSSSTSRRQTNNDDEDEETVRAKLNGLVMGNIKVQASSVRPIPNPNPPPPGYDSFAACLLVMDDNHRAVEWLAYHYHVLPLRYLIVAVDPRSRTSPTAIFNRYRQMGVYIEEWTDHDFLDQRLAKSVVPDDAKLQIKRDRHRARQKVFYKSCLQKMKQANRTFTTMHDTDEFLVYNQPGTSNNSSSSSLRKKKQRSRHNPDTEILPTAADPGGMISYIRQEQANGNKYFQSPCISIPRLHFGAVESTPEEMTKDAPAGFDHVQLDTLRWRKHSKRDDHIKNNLGKVIMDVSRIDIATAPRFRSLHRPIPSICAAPWIPDHIAGLRINHYLGSWESYSFRDDSRRGGERSREVWEFQAEDQQETDDNIRPWLGGFVKANGYNTAKDLLWGAGLPKSFRNGNETAWRSMWINDILKSNRTEGTNPKNHEFDAFVRRKFNSR